MAEIDRYLRFMTENSASDFHLSTGVRPMFRIHGKMAATGDGTAEFNADQVMSLMEEILPDRNREEFRSQNDTDFAYSIQGLGRFRVNVFMDLNGPGAVFRHIPEELWTMKQLGLPPGIEDLCMLSSGLVLVTGPTGSGKSTSLAAMVDKVMRAASRPERPKRRREKSAVHKARPAPARTPQILAPESPIPNAL